MSHPRLTAEQLRGLPDHVPLEELGWRTFPESESTVNVLKLPYGIRRSDFLREHSPPNMLEEGKLVAGGPTKYGGHRGFIEGAKRIDNTMAAIYAALQFSLRIVEIDVQSLCAETAQDRPQFIFGHERKSTKVLYGIDEFWSNLKPSDMVGQPIIARQVKDGKFTDKFWVTDQTITEAWAGRQEILDQFPDATIIFDTKDSQSAQFIAAASHESCYKNSIVQFYTWGPDNAEELNAQVNAMNPDPNWKKNVRLVPVVQCPPLTMKLAADGRQVTYKALYSTAHMWLDSFLTSGLNIAGVMLIIAGIGARYDVVTGTATEEQGRDIRDEEILVTYRNNRILMDLYDYVRENYTLIPIMGIIRASDLQQKGKFYKWGHIDRSPVEWGKNADIFKAHSTPGYAHRYFHFDYIMADLIARTLEVEAWLKDSKVWGEVHHNPRAIVE